MILYYAFVGKESVDLQTLDNCRKVCKTWKAIIESSVWPSPTKEWGIITKSMIEKNWAQRWVPKSFPTNKMIVHAKALGESKDNLKNIVLQFQNHYFLCRI